MSIIEHVVLFKVKDDVVPSDMDSMVDRINSLLPSLPHLLLHLSITPLRRIQSSPSPSPSLTFTHILHCRYKSKQDLHAYTVHPIHVAAVKANEPLIHDAMALDWVAEDLHAHLVPPPGSAVRVNFFKLKEEGSLGNQNKDEVLEGIRGIQGGFKQAVQVTSGENFSPGRAKGFSIGSLVVFPGLSDLEGFDANEESHKYEKNDKIKESLESVLVLDYVVPSPKA